MKNALLWLGATILLIVAGVVGYIVIQYLKGE